jgi:hypothetical protein
LRTEEQLLRKNAEARGEEEQRLREVEQRLREEEEEQLREEEQKRRHEAEAPRSSGREHNTKHDPHRVPRRLSWTFKALRVVTNCTLTTQGDTTNPTGIRFPRRTLSGRTLPHSNRKHGNGWQKALQFSSQQAFPSLHQLDLFRRNLEPITREVDLNSYERDAAENPVWQLLGAVYDHTQLREALGLKGVVTFESHIKACTVQAVCGRRYICGQKVKNWFKESGCSVRVNGKTVNYRSVDCYVNGTKRPL